MGGSAPEMRVSLLAVESDLAAGKGGRCDQMGSWEEILGKSSSENRVVLSTDVNYDMVTSKLLIQLTPGRALHCKLFTQVWFKAKFRRLSSHIRLLCPFLSKSKISTYY